MSDSRWLTMLLVQVLFVTAALAAGAEDRYRTYETTPARISDLDWRLMHVNVALAVDDIETSFDSRRRIFVGVGWVLTSTVDRATVEQLRDLFASQAAKLAAKLAREIPDFKARAEQDLEVEFLLGRVGDECIATYKKGTIQFTEAFYAYLRERGRR